MSNILKSANVGLISPTVNNTAVLYDDFDTYNVGAGGYAGKFIFTGNAGGGILSTSALGTNQPQAGHYGIVGAGVGTTNNATGAGQIVADLASCFAGYAEIILDFQIQTPVALSAGATEYVLDFGFNDSVSTPGQAANGFAIQYLRTTSTNWSAYTAKGAAVTTVTTADSTLAVTANAWWNGRIYIHADGSAVDFYIAPTGTALKLIGTSTTNIPTAVANKTFLQFQIYKAATYATQNFFSIDWVKMYVNFTTPR